MNEDKHHDYLSFAIAALCVGIAVAVIWSMDDSSKPSDCNTLNHTRPLDGAPCFPKHYDRSKR